MELFAITCTTCKSKLKVRDPAAIGQILSCPKCGGMVMVKPPPAFSEATEQKSDLPTATEVESPSLRFGETPASSAFDVLDELLSDAPPRMQPPRPSAPKDSPAKTSATAPAVPKPRFVGGPPVHRSSTPPAAKASAPAVPAVPPAPTKAQPPAVTAEVTVAPPRPSKSATNFKAPPPPAEAPTTTAKTASTTPVVGPRKNFWILMAGSIVLGIGLALIAVCAVILLRPTAHARVNAPPDAKQPAHSPQMPVAVSPNEPVISPPPTIPPAAEPPAPQPASPPHPIDAVTTTPSETKTKPNDDPPGLTAAPAAAATSANPSPDSLAKFDKLLGGGDNEQPTTPPATTEPPAAIPVDTTPPRPQAPRPPPRDIDIAKCLATPLLGIESTGTTLAEFVNLMSDLSTVPITLEVPFLPATPESAVLFKAANTTVGAALKDALTTLRLECIVADNQLIVRRQEPEPFRALTHEVKDLTGGDEQRLHDLVELLQAVVEPGAWGDGAGQGSITLDAAKNSVAILHRRAVQFEVLIALEKLRAGRTPPLPFKTPVTTTLFQLDSRLKQAGPRLVKPLSLNYSQPTRIVEIFDRLRGISGVRILVNWHDVAAAGWNPAGEGTLVASNQSLADALEALLTPLDLTFRIIDAQTLEVVTPARLNDAAELEAYKVADLLTGDITSETLIAKARTALGEDAFISGGGSGEIRYDDDGKCLLAWLPQPKQRELEVLLAMMRGGGK